MRKQMMFGALAMLASFAVSAAPATTLSKADAKAAAAIKEAIEARYPGAKIISVQPSKHFGLYEVFTGDSVSYSNATGDLLFVGSIMDTKNKTNLTVERLSELNAVDFSQLPLDRAIKIVKGDGSRTLAVFTDPDCPFCQELEKTLATMTNVTVYNFLFPIASLHPDAPARARALWCAPDRGAAWNAWMVERKPPEWKTCAGDPVDELAALGAKLRINSTPTVIAASGKRFDGAMPAPKLEEFLGGKAAGAVPSTPAADGAPPTASRQ